MSGLLRCLWNAAKEWRSNKRDLRLFIDFLDSAPKRRDILKLASFPGKCLMRAIEQFVESELETAEFRFECFFGGPDGEECRLTAPVFFHLHAMIVRALARNAKEYKGDAFLFVTEKAPIPIYFRLPEMPELPRLPQRPPGDLSPSELANHLLNLAHAVKETNERMARATSGFIFSKTPLYVPGATNH